MIYKNYENGKSFYQENQFFLERDFFTRLQTVFFKGNSLRFTEQNQSSFAFMLEEGSLRLVCLNEPLFNGLIYGSEVLAKDAGRHAAMSFSMMEKLLGEEVLVETFSEEYCKYRHCSYRILQKMSIMYLEKLNYFPTKEISRCQKEDISNLIPFVIEFSREALKEQLTEEQAHQFITENYQNIYFLREHNQIVSMAIKTRTAKDSCAISHVYTSLQHRGQGHAKEVVSYLAKQILSEDKVPYLYVDQQNPISNRLYLHLGFHYLCNQLKIVFQ